MALLRSRGLLFKKINKINTQNAFDRSGTFFFSTGTFCTPKHTHTHTLWSKCVVFLFSVSFNNIVEVYMISKNHSKTQIFVICFGRKFWTWAEILLKHIWPIKVQGFINDLKWMNVSLMWIGATCTFKEVTSCCKLHLQSRIWTAVSGFGPIVALAGGGLALPASQCQGNPS